MRTRRRSPAITIAIGVLAGCGILGPDIDTVGTVRFVDVEGGCWVIETADRRLQPLDLPEEFMVDDLRVRLEADFRRDLTGFCPGEIVELKSIVEA